MTAILLNKYSRSNPPKQIRLFPKNQKTLGSYYSRTFYMMHGLPVTQPALRGKINL